MTRRQSHSLGDDSGEGPELDQESDFGYEKSGLGVIAGEERKAKGLGGW